MTAVLVPQKHDEARLPLQATIAKLEEELHEHDWHVQGEVSGALDEEGLLIDFHLLERVLDEVLSPFVDGCFNGTPPFDVLNPSAECIARHIIETILHHALPVDARGRIEWGRAILEEAPGCHATCFAFAARENTE